MGKNSLASALVRLLGGKENAEGSPYAVELEDILAWVGRLGLEPLPNGGVIPVVEEMASTIISYALSCQEYRSRFREFQTLALRRHDSPTSAPSPPSSPPPPGQRSGDRKTRKEREEKEAEEDRGLERLMLYPEKSHIKIKFQDVDPHGEVLVRFTVNVYWATQFRALRTVFFRQARAMGEDASTPPSSPAASSSSSSPSPSSSPSSTKEGEGGTELEEEGGGEEEEAFIKSLASSGRFDATGGKSGATFSITDDGRFVLKQINDKELAMFLEAAPAYFDYVSKSLFHAHPSVLCKILGLFETESHNRCTGKKVFKQLVVMPNIFFNRCIHRVYDLKGSTRSRYISLSAEEQRQHDDQERERQEQEKEKIEHEKEKRASPPSLPPSTPSSPVSSPASALPLRSLQPPTVTHQASATSTSSRQEKEEGGKEGGKASQQQQQQQQHPLYPRRIIRRTLLDENLLEYTQGKPVPLFVPDQAYFMRAMANDTAFLAYIKIIDYSILVGVDEEQKALVVGIIDYMRQYDIIKKMERMGKSVGMIAGQAEPTVIQPQPYRSRFQAAMERYFAKVPDKWTPSA